MAFPKPIRYDPDIWLVMRSNAVLPKAIIQRFRDRRGTEQFLLVKWELEPGERVLMGVYPTLEQANEKVLFDKPHISSPIHEGPPNGRQTGNWSTAGSSQ